VIAKKVGSEKRGGGMSGGGGCSLGEGIRGRATVDGELVRVLVEESRKEKDREEEGGRE